MSALRQVAEVFAGKEKDEFALQSVKAIGDEYYKMLAFISMADAKKELGENDEAAKYLSDAHFHAGLIDRFGMRSEGYNDLAKRFYELGDNEKSREICLENLETISQIKDESVRAVALASLSDLYTEAEFELNDAEKEILKPIIIKAQS